MVITWVLLGASAALAEEGDAQLALDAMVAEAPGCVEARDTCLGLDVFVAFEEGVPVVDAAWLSAQLSETARHYEPLSVSFEVAKIAPLPETFTEIDTRKQRNRLGREAYTEGTLQVYIVKRLANVDDPGDIYGVHWRDRGNMSNTWVILSSVAWKSTLSHEIGHFFELPHSKYDISIMNKTPRADPPAKERTFHKKELRKMRKNLAEKLESGRLVPRT